MNYLKKDLLRRLGSEPPELFGFFDASGLDGIWFLDMETMQDEWYSPKFKAILGFSDEEVPNCASWWQERIHPDDLPDLLDLLQTHLANPDVPFDTVVRYFHKNGSIVTVRCRGIVIFDEGGKPIRMLGTHTDVSALIDTEHSLRKSNTTLRAFAATVSHDLKAPIRQSGAMAGLAKAKIEADDNAGAIKILDQIAQVSERAMGTVDGLLRLSEAQRYTPPEDARADLHQCTQSFAFEAALGGADIQIDPLPEIAGDPELMTVLLSNLISNSIKYNDKPRAKIHVRSFVEGGHLVVQVDDNGPGIPPAERDRIFEPLERGSASPGVEGHGIGLALSHAIAEAHSGELTTCSSQLGGACIELRLPRSLIISQETEADSQVSRAS